MRPDHYGLVAAPAKVEVFGLAICVGLACVEHAAIAHPGPVVLRHGEQQLKAAIPPTGAGGRFRQAPARHAELLQLLSCADPVVIQEQQAARWGACDHANGLGAAGCDFCGRLLMGQRVGLPLFLVGAFVAIDRNEAPGGGKLLELL